jgi:hypothetical protein
MADLTADANIRLLGEAKTEKWFLNTTTAVRQAFKGQPMIIDQSVDTLNAEPFVTATVVAATDVCLGIAAEGKTVILNDPEKTEIEIYTYPSIVGFKSTVFTTADLGKEVYMSDSATLVGVAGIAQNPWIGQLFKVEDGYCYVKLNTPVVCAGA